MLVYIMDIWKECFSYTWLPCVRTDLIYFKNLATGSLFCLFLWGREVGTGIGEQQQAMVCICFLPDLTSQQKRDYL